MHMWTCTKSIALAGLLLGGCAGPPKQAVTVVGALPAAGWSFGVQPDDAAALPAFEPRVRACLTGLGAASVQDRPAYIVLWAFSDRPGATNVFVHQDAPSAAASTGVWRDGKAPGKRGSAFLTIGLIDATSAREVYRVSAVEHHGRKADADRPARLIAAACGAMRGP